MLRLRDELHGYKQNIESSTRRDPGHPALSCLYSHFSPACRFFIFFSLFNHLSRQRPDESAAGRTKIAIVRTRALSRLSVQLHRLSSSLFFYSPLSSHLLFFFLSFFFVLSRAPASSRLANLRRIHTDEDPSGTKTVTQTYVIAGVSASFFLRISFS